MRTLLGSSCPKCKSQCHRFVFHVHLLTWCRYSTSLTVRSRVFCLHLPLHHHHPDLQHPQRPWQGVAETAQAHPLTGVGLAEWLTQPQTQVMRPSSPTSSATWTQCTRRSISPTATTISSARTTLISTTDPEGLQHSGAPSSSKQTAASRVPFNVRTFKPLENLNLSDVNYTKQVHGQIRLRETRLVCMENWN